MNLTELLHLEMEPIGIFFGNTTAPCDLVPTSEAHNCLVPLLMAAGKGKTIAMDEANCTCPGGGVGCCFGDGFTRGNPNIHIMLSQGMGDKAPPGMPIHMKDGERFYCTPELAMKWRNAMPYSDKGYPRTIFAPLSKWGDIGTPDLVYVFANPDQLSALVILLGSHNGRAINTLAPFGAACHSIVFAAEQMDKEAPMAIIGLFDISQRRPALKNLLSLTMPYPLWEGINQDLDKSCLTTHSWKEIEPRL